MKIGDFPTSKVPEPEAFVAMSEQVLLMGEEKRVEDRDDHKLVEVVELLVSMNELGVPVRVGGRTKRHAVLRGQRTIFSVV